MLTLSIEGRTRDLKPATLRSRGVLPAVFYGRKEESTSIVVSAQDFLKVWQKAGESSVLELAYGKKKMMALIHDVALDPITSKPIHVDFYVVEADKKVEVAIPLEFIDDAPALKQEGMSLVKVLYELKVAGLPKDLPHTLTVSVKLLVASEDQILARDLSLPLGITLVQNPADVVAAIAVMKEEEAPKEFDASAVEIEKKGKVDEEGKEAESETPTAEVNKESPPK